MTFKPGSSKNGRFQEETWGRGWGGAGAVFSKPETPVQNGRVGTYGRKD